MLLYKMFGQGRTDGGDPKAGDVFGGVAGSNVRELVILPGRVVAQVGAISERVIIWGDFVIGGEVDLRVYCYGQ